MLPPPTTAAASNPHTNSSTDCRQRARMGKKWVPLESNPEVMTEYISKIGCDTSDYVFHDVFGLEEVSTGLEWELDSCGMRSPQQAKHSARADVPPRENPPVSYKSPSAPARTPLAQPLLKQPRHRVKSGATGKQGLASLSRHRARVRPFLATTGSSSHGPAASKGADHVLPHHRRHRSSGEER